MSYIETDLIDNVLSDVEKEGQEEKAVDTSILVRPSVLALLTPQHSVHCLARIKPGMIPSRGYRPLLPLLLLLQPVLASPRNEQIQSKRQPQ